MKHKKTIIILACVLIAAIFAVGGLLFLKHEKRQSTYAQDLNTKIDRIDQEQTFYESEQEKAITGLKETISDHKTEQEKALSGFEKKLSTYETKQQEVISSLEAKLSESETSQTETIAGLETKISEHEKSQTEALTNLEQKIDDSRTEQQEFIAGIETKLSENGTAQEKALFALTERLNKIEEMQQIMEKDDSYAYKFNCLYGNSYNVLVIGNSITTHPKKEYWWAERGMAASSDEKDYVHLLKARLQETHENVNIKAVQFRSWEIQAYERKDEYGLIDRYLNKNIDWIIVQLGENVSDTTTYEADYIELLLHLHSTVPNAKMLTIGNFWKDETKDSIKKRVSEGIGIAYVDLSEIQDDPDYQIGLGSVVLGEDGEKHVISHEGVAAHPNDRAMGYIAQKIMECIKQFE